MNRFIRSCVSAAVAAVLTTSAALAEQTYQIGIEAQPLAAAIKEFAEQSGLQVVYRGEIVQGLKSTRVIGALAAADALGTLLEGTGLVVSRIDAETLLISKPINEGKAQLQETSLRDGSSGQEVKREQPVQQLAAASEEPSAETVETLIVHGRFLESDASSAMKLDVPVRDTPFSIASYGQSFMKAIETTTVADLYNYMNGVKKAGNSGYDMTIRGFRTGVDDKNAIMVDGMPGLTGRFGSPPTIGVERIEVVKGPMSLLYGQIQPGGFVNIISKKPRDAQATSIDVKGMTYWGNKLGFGDASGYNFALDSTGPIDTDGEFLYRVVGEYTDKDAFRDFSYEKGYYIAPSFTWNLSDATSATIIYERRELETSYDFGLVAPRSDFRLIAPITTSYHEPGDFRKETGNTVSLAFKHSFANGLQWNTSVRSAQNTADDSAITSVAVRPDGRTLQRRAREFPSKRRYNFIDTSISAAFDTGSIGHKLLVGVNGGRDTADENRIQFYNGGACPGPTCLDIDLYNPVYGRVPPRSSLPAVNTPQAHTHRLYTSDAYGIYVNNLMTLSERWKASIGARSVREKQTIEELRLTTPTVTKDSNKGIVPAAGLLFQPNDVWTIYSAYAESYVPAVANAQDVDGRNPFRPQEGQLLELGVKSEGLFDGVLNATVSVYQIDKNDTLSTFACARGTCSIQVGAERSKGAELEMNARLTADWQLSFNYAYTDSRVTESLDPVLQNARLANVPYNSANVWSRYDFSSGALNGLGVGAGVVYTGERTGTLPSTAVPAALHLPAYTVADLALYYVTGRYSFNLKVNNVLDEEYYESAGFSGALSVAPGAPRNVSLSMRANF